MISISGILGNAKRGTRVRKRPNNKFWLVRPGSPRKRMTVLVICFVAIALVLGLRCVYIQGLDLADNASQALMLHPQQIPATRGTITDRNGQVLAESESAVNITADPTIVATNGLSEDTMSLANKLRAHAGPGIIAGLLSAYLGGDFTTYYDRLTTTRTDAGTDIRYVMLARNVLKYNNIPLSQKLSALGYVGLYREQAPVRNYPNGTVAANVLGFMTFSDDLVAQDKYPWTGGNGLELSLNSELAGVDGEEIFETSPYGKIPTGTSITKEPQEGISYGLTLDAQMQYMQDQRLAAAVKETGSRSGMAITMTVSGEILAMSTYPSFDPNDLSGMTLDDLRNRTVMDTYEPGSVEKVLTMAALIDQGLAEPDTQVIVPSRIKSGDSWVSDVNYHDTEYLTAAGVLAHSSNIGTVVLSRQMSAESLVKYLRGFGLGSLSGIGLPGEEPGYIPDSDDMSDQTKDNVAFGQGLAVTAVQEAGAIAAVANGGVYVSPHIIKSATASDGTPIAVAQPEVRRVISQETSTKVLSMMEGVVEYNRNSFDIDGYRTAGKSGTAEAVDPSTGRYGGGYYSSYAGVAPADNPQLVTYAVLDHPTTGSSGTGLVAPIVKDIMSVALPRYGVPTSTSEPPHLPLNW